MSDYASQIAVEAMTLLRLGFGNAFKTYRMTPMLQVHTPDLPILGVYILRERREPDGQCNQTIPKMIHALTLGFSGAVHVETDKQEQLVNWLEDQMSLIDELLLCDPHFLNLTEGVLSMDRIGQYAKVGEITLFEIRVEMTVQFRSYFSPTITDVLNKVVITTEFPDAAHVASGTPQLEVFIEVDTTKQAEPASPQTEEGDHADARVVQ